MPVITKIIGQEILDSRGTPTLEVTVQAEGGIEGRASVPAGAFAGKYEAKPINDIARAVETIGAVIAPNLSGHELSLVEVDQGLIQLDASPDKSNLGGNTMLGVSLACARAAARALNQPLYQFINQLFGRVARLSLPIPMFNIINGGAHADNNLPFQEFMVVPSGEGLSFAERLRMGRIIFQTLKDQIQDLGKNVAVGEEGGFAPQLSSNEEAIELLVAAVQQSGFTPRTQVQFGIDVAAGGIPDLRVATYPYHPQQYYEKLVTDYPVEMIEDPFHEDEWQEWAEIVERLGSRVYIVGDDLFSTNPARLKKGIEKRAANSISIKPNQIGTLTETLNTIRLAREANMSYQISHRAGETEDTFIADLAVGTGAKYIKAGAPNRGERVAKYNQLLRIEQELLANR